MRRLLHVAMTRARKGLVLAWAEAAAPGVTPRPSPFYEEARAAARASRRRSSRRSSSGRPRASTPRSGSCATSCWTRSRGWAAGSGEMRLDTYLDVDQAVSRYLELIKVAALIERAKEGQALEEALPAVNEILVQCATPEQREILEQSALDAWLRDSERDPARRPAAAQNGSEPSLDPFIPRRGRGLMLSASDIETYRICPLKYKFARVFRIPQEATIHQRFGIVLHQVLERFHSQGGGPLAELMDLFEASWRRWGFGDSDDERQFRERAVEALERYWRQDRESEAEPVWFERSFSFRLGPHVLRGRVDRVDRRPDGSYELIDYKTGKARTEEELREDVQLSLYQMGARESWRLETSAQSYLYVMTGEKVPVEHSDEELERVRATVSGHRRRDPEAGLRADAVGRDLLLLRLPDHLPGGGEVEPSGSALRASLAQEALEVARDRVGRGQALLRRRVLRLDLVHGRLEALDERLHLRVARDRRAHLALVVLGGGLQLPGVDDHAGGSLERPHQRQRDLGVGGRRHVVRHRRPQARRRQPGGGAARAGARRRCRSGPS